ncbi:MAG: ABC transporter permease, partial [Kordiimonas sp.]
MVKQIIKSGLRQIWRKPLLPVLNMLGLAGGIAVTILILLYSHTELNYDSWVTDQKDLYRIEGQFLGASSGYMDSTPTPLAPTLLRDVDEVETAIRVRNQYWPVKYGDFINYETVTSVDAGFLTIFPLEFVEGSSASAFQTLNNVVVSESMAHKYFGDDQAIGQTLTINADLEYTVSGVFKDQPEYTDYPFDFVAPFQEKLVSNFDSWSSVSLETLVRLKEGSNLADVQEKLNVIVDQHRPFNAGTDYDMRERFRMFLQPFSDLHLGSSGRTPTNPIGNYATIYGFLAIAALVLVISTFNYVSLAMARALEREKEFCIRKVTGASFGQIVRHVMAESIIQTSLAALLGLLIADDTLPYFSSMLGAEYQLADLLNATGFIVFAGGTLVLGILAGLYPAIISSSFRPAKFLSGGKSQRAGVNRLRGALVFVQFAVSIALLIGTVTIARQMSYISELDLGFDQNNLLLVR